MTPPAPKPALRSIARRPRWRRRLLWSVFLTAFLAVAAYLWLYWSADRQLHQAIAEADALDPGWRMDEVLNNLRPATKRNPAAEQLLKAAALVPSDIEVPLPPQGENPILLAGPQLQDLKENADVHAAARREARGIADIPRGLASPMFSGADVADNRDWKAVTPVLRLLRLDAALHAEIGDADAAAEACLGMYRVAQALVHEPLDHFQIARWSWLGEMAQSVERCLALGEPRAGLLEQLQKTLEAHQEGDAFYQALRSHRARQFAFLQAVREERISKEVLNQRLLTLDLRARLTPAYWKSRQGMLLAYLNKLVETGQGPNGSREPAFRDAIRTLPVNCLHLGLRAHIEKALEHLCSSSENVRVCLIYSQAALAAERYRIKEGKWPTDWDQLIAARLLREVPVDPKDQQPFRPLVLKDGWCVYSPSRTTWNIADPETAMEFRRGPATRDVGFRLWNPSARRQAPVEK